MDKTQRKERLTIETLESEKTPAKALNLASVTQSTDSLQVAHREHGQVIIDRIEKKLDQCLAILAVR